MSFKWKTSVRVLPFVCKQDGEAENETENAIEKYLKKVPVPK
jgi:hypothetical protein